ncbi:MAG TPA: ADP-ribosylation factor-like protein [Candidatus Lokiarchaeia archaeon]|nr:ADP-ribosylation factor-like protein [Candidatus Lokiarchaeia archaeon]
MDMMPNDFQEKISMSKKMIFSGLSDAGKTSINRTLKNDIIGTALVKPTYLVDRSIFKYLDYEILQHDMGGQKKYLINYLKEPGNFFSKTDVCIYVIDIIDDKRYEESLEFFGNMLNKFDEIEVVPSIWILFHKAEKYLFEADEEQAATIDGLREKFLATNANRFKIEFEATSVYDRWGLSRVFARIFQSLYPRNELVVELLKTIATTVNASAAVLLDDQLLPLADYTDGTDMEKIIKTTAPYLFKIEEGIEALRPTWKRWIKLEVDDIDIIYLEIPQEEDKKQLHLYLIGELGTLESAAILPQIGSQLFELLQTLYAP